MKLKSITFTLREATEDDYLFLWRLTVTTMREYIAVSSGWNHARQQEQFRKRFVSNRWRIVVDPGGNDVGGFAVDRREREMVLTDIYVMPSHQGQGIGAEILKRLIAESVLADQPLLLVVLKANPKARRLYERIGMRVIDEADNMFVMSS